MASSLNLSLPEPPRQRARASVVHWLNLFLLAALLVLLLVERRPHTPVAPASSDMTEAARLKSLAVDLEKRTLYVQAEQVWAEYMAAGALSLEEKAETLYRRGKCLKEGGRPAEAARRLSEVDGFPIPREEKRKARQLLIECLDLLGKRDVRDSVARSFAIGEEEKGTAVARVGSDIITREEVRADLVSVFAETLKLQGAPLTPVELSQRAAELADEQLKDPESARRAVQQAVSLRVLYREGLERGFADDGAIQEALSRFRTSFIANRVVESEAENALKALGPTEIQNHYEAHKEKFVEKAGVELSFARFPGAAEAEAAVEKLKDPGQAAQVKMERAKGIAAEGEPVPELGMAPEITAHLLALDEGQVSSRPIEHAGAFYAFRAEKKRPARQLSLKEAEPRVRADLAALKRKDAMESLRALLSQKFQVELVDEKNAGGPAGEKPAAGGPEGKSAKDAPGPASKDALPGKDAAGKP